MAQKGAAPKKETARITLPPESTGTKSAALPKATVKMGQTQPLAQRPAAAKPGGTMPPPPVLAAAPANDSTSTALSIFALVLSLAVLAAVGMIYKAVGV
jgi:hypothetical protein